MNRERERPCWQQCRRTCSREQCYWARWWNRRVTLGTSTAHSARTLLLSSSPSCLLPPRDPFSPLLFFSLFSPCLSLNTLVLGSRSNSEHIYIYLKWGQRKRYARKESEWMGAEEMRWDEMRWWGYLIFISAVNGSFGGHVAGLEWREWASGHHCYADNVFRRFLFLILSFCPSFSIMQCISGYAPCDPSLTWKRTAACTSRKFISHQTRCVLFRTRSLWIFTIFLSEHIQFHR